MHDTRNMMGAIELYCDLLSMPGVLKREHRHYAEELRLLGSRSGALLQHLIEHRMRPTPAQAGLPGAVAERSIASGRAGSARSAVGLRTVVEHCSGLLSLVANGRKIEIIYGAAANVPVAVDEEAVERILVNLVRNAASALDRPAAAGGVTGDTGVPSVTQLAGALRVAVIKCIPGRTADRTPGEIRIGVGLQVNRADDPMPWLLRRVGLTVEDSGCGMTAEQLERVLRGNGVPSPGNHGIGIRVVQELVAASSGNLSVLSVPEVGTRVQIEWPGADAALSAHRKTPATADGRGTIC